jgi:hypothetical protein
MAGGRPRIEINWTIVANAAKVQCTQDEIAKILGISLNKLKSACKQEHGTTLGAYLERFAEEGRMSLRHMQWKQAQKGNPSMLIFLGKQYLGQRDKPESEKDRLEAEILRRELANMRTAEDGGDGGFAEALKDDDGGDIWQEDE